ncbi:GreA/GreB family elongation factor [Bdellovibrionota bacterium FG-2]
MNKQKIIERLLQKLEKEIAVISDAAHAAHLAATHEESRAEDSHDTRGIEASYLAGAQANRVAELKKQSQMLRTLPLLAFKPSDPIALGALVELDLDGQRSFCLLVETGGGLTAVIDGKTVQLLTFQAPLGEALFGKRRGDVVEVEAQKTVREYEVVGIQ